MGRKQRNIGKRTERDWCKFLRKYGIEARTGRQHRGGPDSPDVITNLNGIHFEVTRDWHVFVGSQGLDEKLWKAAQDAGERIMPVVAWRAPRKPWMCSFRVSKLMFATRRLRLANAYCLGTGKPVTMLASDFLTILGYKLCQSTT